MKTLTEIQTQKVNEGISILQQYHLLYLMFETQVGKTPASLSICNKLNKDVLFVTTKKMIKEIPGYIKEFDIKVNVKPVSMDSLHKEIFAPDRIVIVDEAHSFGSYDRPRKVASKRTKALKLVVGDNDVIFLSATPTPENYSLFYYQFWISTHSPFAEYHNFFAWAKDYVNVYTKYLGSIPIKCYDKADINKIEPKIKHLCLTLTKENAGFKQITVEEQIITVEMSKEIKAIYKSIHKDSIYEDDFLTILGDTAAKRMGKLHQLCGGTIIDDNNNKLLLDTAKVETINNAFADAKIAVYYKFIAERTMLVNNLKRQITADVSEFRESSDKVFISQFQSGREGISLATADYLIFYNIDYAFLSYEQTKNRVTNMNRESPPKVVFLLSDLGLDKEILKTVKNKKTFTTRHYGRMK